MVQKFLFTALITTAMANLIACSHTPPPPQSISIAASDSLISRMGRTHTNDDQSQSFGFPGVTFITEVEGTVLNAQLQSTNGNSWIDVILDNGPSKTFNIPAQLTTIELFRFPHNGKHRVEIVHRSENWHGAITLGNLSLTGGGFFPAPKLPKRKMLLLGDSVTCGEAIDRVAGEDKNSRWWNARESYGMLTAKALNAQVNLVCWGGRGLVRSWNGKTDEANLPDFYEYAVGDNNPAMKWNHRQYQPDLIVSAIGTNDFSPGIPDRETYVTAYVKFINKLLANHPNAHIAITEGAILKDDRKATLIDYIREAISRVNNARVHQVTSNYYPGDNQDAHPTKEQHAAMAKDLAPQLKALMDW
jgi:lysophospholipase L1-like esterase